MHEITNGMNKIKIGPITFEIKVCALTHDDMGGVLFNESEIQIKQGLEKQVYKETLLHEILHIVFTQSGHRDKMDEGLIDAIAYSLLDIGIVNLDEF